MIVPTLHGFVVTDVIFGVVSIMFLGQCDIAALMTCALSEYHSPLRRSINAAKSPAPAEGAGKRDELHSKALIKTRLALDRLC